MKFKSNTPSCLNGVGYDEAFQNLLKFNGLPIRIGVYAVIIKNNKVLMVHTRSGSKDIINFPGGAVEPGEGFIEAVKRECQEELGMEITVDTFLYASKSLHVHEDFPHSYMYHFYFLARAKEVSFHAELESALYPLTDLPIESMLPIDKEFIETIDLAKNVSTD